MESNDLALSTPYLALHMKSTKKTKQTPKPIFFNIAKTVLQALGDKSLTRRISYDLMFLICENVL